MTAATAEKTDQADAPEAPKEQLQVQYSTNGLETWRNVLRGRVIVKRAGVDGKERPELIRSGATFQLTPDQRREQEASFVRAKQNMFRSGALQPVILVEGHEDNEGILSNPNHLPEADTAQIFRLKGERFARRIAEIDNPNAVERLITLAEEPKNGAYVAQLRMLERRRDQVTKRLDHVNPKVASGEERPKGPGAFKPVTPG